MARGKQAAKAAKRREEAAQAKTGEVKERLAKERADADALIKALRAEIRQLKDGHRVEAERLAAEEIARLRQEKDEALTQRAATLETVEVMANNLDRMVFNGSRYCSMIHGIPPGAAIVSALTWLTGEDARAIRDVTQFLDEVGLPQDGWAARQLRQFSHHHQASSLLIEDGRLAPSLDTSEEEEDDRIHSAYRPAWYQAYRPQAQRFPRQNSPLLKRR